MIRPILWIILSYGFNRQKMIEKVHTITIKIIFKNADRIMSSIVKRKTIVNIARKIKYIGTYLLLHFSFLHSRLS